MSSRHRILWQIPGIGQLRCLKRNPKAVSFWVEAWKTVERGRQGPFFINVNRHLHRRDPSFAPFLQRHTVYKSERIDQLEKSGNYPTQYLDNARLGLDLLFAALARSLH